MNASRLRHRRVRSAAAPASAVALALALGACGGGDPAVETSTVELDEGVSAAPAELDPAIAEPALDPGAEVGAAVQGAADEAMVAGSDAVDAAAAGASGAWVSLQENWDESVADVQAHFGELSEEDVVATGGDRGALVAVVRERYGLEAEEAERQVADWEATL